MEIELYLDDIEGRISAEQEEALWAQWGRFLAQGLDDPFAFFQPRRVPQPSRIEWPAVTLNSTLGDDEAAFAAMTMQQLRQASNLLASDSGTIPWVRCNYGTGILPSILGTSIFVMDELMETLPTAVPLEGGERGVRQCLERGAPNLAAGQGSRVYEMGWRLATLLASRPKIAKYVRLVHPDFQGPLDVAEVLWGSDIFLAFYEEPQTVHALLSLITDTYCRAMDAWLPIVASLPASDWACHWGFLHRGLVCLRLDSCMNISQEFYREFSMPYDAKIFARYGGFLHSCGKVDHIFPAAAEIDGVYGFNLSQPHYNDMEAVYAATIDRGHRIFGLPSEAMQAMRSAHRPTHGLIMA